MAKQGRISMCRIGNNASSGYIAITVEDDSSSNIITRINLSLHDFANAVTGLGGVKGELEIMPTPESASVFGKEYQVDKITLDTEGFSKYSDEKKVLEMVHANIPEGWELSSDGMNTQQNDTGKHHFTVCRYVDVDEES